MLCDCILWLGFNIFQIAIPYSVIVDVEKSSAMDFSETIEVKVLDQEEKGSVQSFDSYFFAYFHNIAAALDQIRDAVKAYKPHTLTNAGVSEIVHDTTQSSTSVPGSDRPATLTNEQQNKSGYGIKLASLLRPFQEYGSTASTPTQSNVQFKQEPASLTLRSEQLMSSSPSISRSPQTGFVSHSRHSSNEIDGPEFVHRSMSESAASSSFKNYNIPHTYPPTPSPPAELTQIPTRDSATSTSSWGVPSWLRSPRRVFASPSSTSSNLTVGQKGVSEVVSSGPQVRDQSTIDFGFSVLEARDAAEPDVVEKFRSTFAFDEKEQLLGCRSHS